MKKIISLLFVAILALTTGCEDRLDIAQHGNIATQEEYYQTDDEAMAADAALYFAWKASWQRVYYMLSSLGDDSWTGGYNRGDNRQMEQFNEFSFDASHTWLEETYTLLYAIVYKANLIIDNVQPDTDVKARVVAEAKFFRAHTYFLLVNLWGTAPLVDHVLKTDEYHTFNSTPAELWAFIEKDLNEAIGSGKLPSKKSLTDRETGIRVTKETAEAYLGKAYLWQKKYAEAAEQFDKVINSKLYGLYGLDEPGEYGDLMHAVANNNCESMLDVQARNDQSQMRMQFCDVYMAIGWRSEFFTYENPAIMTGTWGFLTPQKSLYDAFVAEEGVNGYRLTQSLKTRAQLADEGIIMTKGSTLPGCEGIFSWKNRLLTDDLILQGVGLFQYSNLHELRYAEILLCAAEAYLQSGKQDKADACVNKVRERAKLAAKTNVTMEDIKLEKRLELCGECVRYLDLLRWGDCPTVLGNQGKYVPSYTYTSDGRDVINEKAVTNLVFGFQNKHNLMPFPESEIMVNPNIVQNTGW